MKVETFLREIVSLSHTLIPTALAGWETDERREEFSKRTRGDLAHGLDFIKDKWHSDW